MADRTLNNTLLQVWLPKDYADKFTDYSDATGKSKSEIVREFVLRTCDFYEFYDEVWHEQQAEG